VDIPVSFDEAAFNADIDEEASDAEKKEEEVGSPAK